MSVVNELHPSIVKKVSWIDKLISDHKYTIGILNGVKENIINNNYCLHRQRTLINIETEANKLKIRLWGIENSRE